MNGFQLDGEAIGDYSSCSASTVGDINGDGVADFLIGADGHAGNTGRGYVIFGDIPPVLATNSLSLSVGAAIQLNSTYLAAYDRNHNNNTLVFIPDGITHGQFEAVGVPGVALTNFTQQQITSGVIQFVHDGTLVAPSYNITVRSDGIAWTGPQPAKINFIGAPPSQFPSVIQLSSLNGKNGFKLDGENNGDSSGSSVSSAGDINGDGYGDLLIGAPYHANRIGRAYVVFGGPNVGSQGILALSNLNGTNGFKLDGEAVNVNDNTGFSVSAIGDFNSDGHDDFIIGAPQNFLRGSGVGHCYVVFGGSGVGNSGLLPLSNLNGTNGFKLVGESMDSLVGYSVNAAGDFNNDGFPDIILGAIGYNNAIGRSYVVCGGPEVGATGNLSLANLNGINGFKLDGNTADDSGISVSNPGDIDGDGKTDLLIGAYSGNNFVGRVYAVLGGSGVGSGSLLSLPSLNRTNGFVLNGESINDYAGAWVNGADDLNGDGLADMIIGAYDHNNGTGRSYVVYGGLELGGSGAISLGSLNGIDGFKLDGEVTGDYSGASLGAAEDINGDGQVDLLIGAFGYANSTGRSYIIFGDTSLGDNGIFNLSSLNGMNGFKLDGENIGDFSGRVVSSAGDINGDGVTDILIGAYGHANFTGRTYVLFGDIPPVLLQNRLTLQQNRTVSLNSTFLSAYDLNHDNSTLVFIPSNVTHGEFELVSQPGVALSNFTQTAIAEWQHSVCP